MRVLSLFLIIAALFFGIDGSVAQTNEPILQKVDRLTIESKGFSIVPPPHWEVILDQPNLMLFMQVPKGSYEKYQRSIQVRSGVEPVIVDKLSGDTYGQLIEKKRAPAFGASAGYKIRNHMVIHLADGNPGVLFYAEFSFEEQTFMEMHILISSEEGHFLMTYTDMAENFQNNGPGTHLDIAYRSMISAQLSSQVGGRYDSFIKLGIGALGLIIFWFSLKFFMGRKSIQFEEEYDDNDEEISDSKPMKSFNSSHSAIESDLNSEYSEEDEESAYSELDPEEVSAKKKGRKKHRF